MDINQLCLDSWFYQQDKGFDTRTVGEDIALMHSELSEALEEHRNGHDNNETYFVTDKFGIAKPEGIPTELADVVIRIAAFCGQYGIDLAYAIDTKIKYNVTRPYKHGGKFI
jgi:NTP pyrophosphatase (non-canonical NTP hydrolase)